MSLILAGDLISTIAGDYCFPRLLLALFAFIEHFPELVAKSRLKTISAQLKLKLELSLTICRCKYEMIKEIQVCSQEKITWVRIAWWSEYYIKLVKNCDNDFYVS